MIATKAEPMMRGARRPVRAANQAPNAIPKVANALGGTVILVHQSESTTKRAGKEGIDYSCAFQVANPKSAMIVG